MYISTMALARKTGATYRQIDYWCCNGVISPVGENRPGSGIIRKFDKEIIDRVMLLVRLSKAFHYLNIHELKRIFEAYDQGFVEFGDGIILSWRMNLE